MKYMKLSEKDTEMFSRISKEKTKCKHCGHTVLISNRKGKIICNVCGYMIYKEEILEFKEKLKLMGIGE